MTWQFKEKKAADIEPGDTIMVVGNVLGYKQEYYQAAIEVEGVRVVQHGKAVIAGKKPGKPDSFASHICNADAILTVLTDN